MEVAAELVVMDQILTPIMVDQAEVVLQVLSQDLLLQNLAAVAELVGQMAAAADPVEEEMEQIAWDLVVIVDLLTAAEEAVETGTPAVDQVVLVS